jgi:transposase-like protein
MASKRIHQMTIKEWEAAFPTEDACADYLVAHRWPKGKIVCPRCGAEVTHSVSTMAYRWQCYTCAPDSGYRFSHIAGTVFENTNKPLRDWFRVLHMMLTSKKGVSALQVHRVMGFGSYKTAWYMCHRLRAALGDKDFHKLMGIVELDETFIGGKAKNRHWDKRGPGRGVGGGPKGKSAVIGAIARKGNIIARAIEHVDIATISSFVHETVSNKVSLLATDEWPGYKRLDREYHREAVDHRHERYVIGAVHTNTIEGFWSLLKRGVMGTYHKVSKKYLPLYVAEFCFRYNNRENEDIFGEAMRGC